MTERGLCYPEAEPADVTTVSMESDMARQWGDYVAAGPDGTIYHSPRWGSVMQRIYGNEPFYMTARRGGRVVGICQLILQNSLLFGRRLSSLPYFDASGVLADDAPARKALLNAAAALRDSAGARAVELRQHARLAEASGPVRCDKVSLTLPLDDPERLWAGLKAKVRNQVRKARKGGLESIAGGPELIKEFHDIYVRNMRDLGSPPHSRRFFEQVFAEFPSSAGVVLVRGEGRAVAAGFTLTDARAMRMPWAASDWRFRGSSANMLLYWTMIEQACGLGLPAFDFGRSTWSSGTHRFKMQWGAVERGLMWHYLPAPQTDPPNLRPEAGRWRLACACWRKTPLVAVRTLGPRLIAKLS